MHYADCDGRTVSYEADGPDDGSAPLILFQPPGASGASIWRPVAAVLQDRFRTAAVNRSGYGDTEAFAGPEPMTLRDEAALFAAVIRAELPNSRGRTAHIVGHSYGGTIALVLALAWPELVGRLTLLEPAPYVLLREAGEAALAEEIEAQRTAASSPPYAPAGTQRRWNTTSTISTAGRVTGAGWKTGHRLGWSL